MARFEVDTNKMKEYGQDIMNITQNLNELFSQLFLRISRMTTNTGEWIGNSAQEFVRLSKIDKAQYIMFNNELYKLGKLLNDYSYYLSDDIENIRG